MSEAELIVRVGAEGGDWTLVGRRRPTGEWEFQTRLTDQSDVLLGEGREIRRSSEWLSTWRAAMQSFASYPWGRLYPLAVHTDFRELIWDALVRRGEFVGEGSDAPDPSKWATLCAKSLAAQAELAAGPDADGVLLRRGDGYPIESLDDWTRPKKAYQWKDGRSAKELGKAWLAAGKGHCPSELRRLLDSNKLTQGIRLLEAWPEYVTSLPEPGEGRNHDLYIRGDQYGVPVIICVEAKSDEPFGDAKVGDYVRRAEAKVNDDGSPVPSGVPARARALVSLFEDGADPLSEPYASWRYQLLTAVAGTALQAGIDGSPLAVLVIHEFLSDQLDQEKLKRNDTDFREMLVSLNHSLILPGSLVGPIRVRSSTTTEGQVVDVFIGKIITDIDQTKSY